MDSALPVIVIALAVVIYFGLGVIIRKHPDGYPLESRTDKKED